VPAAFLGFRFRRQPYGAPAREAAALTQQKPHSSFHRPSLAANALRGVGYNDRRPPSFRLVKRLLLGKPRLFDYFDPFRRYGHGSAICLSHPVRLEKGYISTPCGACWALSLRSFFFAHRRATNCLVWLSVKLLRLRWLAGI